MFVKAQEIIIEKVKVKGSNRTAWNYTLDGAPFGQVWTFTAKGEVHRYHAKTLAGAYADFATRVEADAFMRGQM